MKYLCIYNVQAIITTKRSLLKWSYLSENAIYEHKCLENIKILYKQAGMCDYQQQFKDNLKDSIVYTPEGFTNNSPIYPITSSPIKKPSAQKSLCVFTDVLEAKRKELPCA